MEGVCAHGPYLSHRARGERRDGARGSRLRPFRQSENWSVAAKFEIRRETNGSDSCSADARDAGRVMAHRAGDTVRVVLGHVIFDHLHPYLDRNGRTWRFLMDVMLAAGGYPWTVIPVQPRNRCMAALEAASVGQDIGPFASFLTEQVSI